MKNENLRISSLELAIEYMRCAGNDMPAKDLTDVADEFYQYIIRPVPCERYMQEDNDKLSE